ncbi:hypothetical protein FSP39_014843 [Pinctada imbricata]|uniref:Uncharacterized protein n=1 Tax=Pinctada imbricata TaxID=66713 RepID=A0AA88Y4Y7_PINIB|nr:hypothetical protein FSP39_014843 [Pinctada imbricata]
MLLLTTALFVSFLSSKLADAQFGPKYPITAALFQDRFEEDLWDEALSGFAADGGNTVWLEENDLAKDGITVSAFASYQYEEDFSDAIMRCPKYDKKIVTTNTYYRLVLPAEVVSDPCNLSDNAIVLFTSLSGPDPHDLLLKSAMKVKFHVYFGLPRVPRSWGGQFDAKLMPAYFELVQRVLS